jgi:hypothetical protein
MPEVNQIFFKYQELAEALVKKADLHEGRWQLIMAFGLTGANLGPSAAELVPGAAIAITNVGLQKATAESPESLTVDAAKVNPIPSTGREQPSTQSRGTPKKKAPQL